VVELESLLSGERGVSEKAVAAINGYRKSGIMLAISTSHTENVLKNIIGNLEVDLLILCDGAIVKYRGLVIYVAAIPIDIANNIIAALIKSKSLIDLTVDSEEYFFSMRPSTEYEQNHGYSNTVVTDFSMPLIAKNILKITPRLKCLFVARSILEKHSEIYLEEFKKKGYQFKSRLATRDNAILSVCAMLKVASSEVEYKI
jgi:hydroxymethylpyrimidine pyrophosphatase-like HAD family hydrolase